MYSLGLRISTSYGLDNPRITHLCLTGFRTRASVVLLAEDDRTPLVGFTIEVDVNAAMLVSNSVFCSRLI
jgi:hypothetical protein